MNGLSGSNRTLRPQHKKYRDSLWLEVEVCYKYERTSCPRICYSVYAIHVSGLIMCVGTTKPHEDLRPPPIPPSCMKFQSLTCQVNGGVVSCTPVVCPGANITFTSTVQNYVGSNLWLLPSGTCSGSTPPDSISLPQNAGACKGLTMTCCCAWNYMYSSFS